MKKLLIVIGVLIALVVIVIAIVPFVFDANRYRPEIESRLSQALGRDVKIGSLQLSIFSGGITANDITVAENPAYGTQPFVKASELKVGVEMSPLIFHKELKIESLVLDNPEVRLLESANGKWNVSTLGASSSQSQQAKPTTGASHEKTGESAGTASNDQSAGELSINKLKSSNGRIDVGDATGKQQSYTDLSVTA